ncbi:MAG TPA: rhodanese-like domain-containing protein [Steroidobacteraceae bacterium]|nr:rhodanese-like domain-containing protein [Steroidobacteraceae bacterium]
MRHALALAALLALVTAPPALAGDAATIAPEALVERLAWGDRSLVVLDVRTPEEFAAGHVAGARNIPHTQIVERLVELGDARERDVVVYCRSGTRSAIALEKLREAGFTRLYHLEGDWLRWSAEKLPAVMAPAQP